MRRCLGCEIPHERRCVPNSRVNSSELCTVLTGFVGVVSQAKRRLGHPLRVYVFLVTFYVGVTYHFLDAEQQRQQRQQLHCLTLAVASAGEASIEETVEVAPVPAPEPEPEPEQS